MCLNLKKEVAHLFGDSGCQDLKDLVVLDGEVPVAGEVGYGWLRVDCDSLRQFVGEAEIRPVVIVLVAVVLQSNVRSEVCAMIFVAINYVIFLVVEYLNLRIAPIGTVYNPEKEGCGITILPSTHRIPI